ncbi:TetR/AcrR family transcriptional regulator [Nocardia sp. SC052]|uniref:TetR/AcrR family transcriptional regulator n=1 Tax=Nocardia sichangensis TaxID=3385975 RepID=UPI0039A2FFAD
MPAEMMRAERSRAAILRAAFELYQEQSYNKVTIEGIAARAGVGKPTVYRRWPSKGAVVLDAVIEAVPPAPFPDTGDIERDLRSWLYGIVDLLADPKRGPLFAGLVGAAQHDHELAAAWRERLYRPTRRENVERLCKAKADGQLPDLDPDLIIDLLAGPVWFRLLVVGERPTRQLADKALRLVIGASARSAKSEKRAL